MRSIKRSITVLVLLLAASLAFASSFVVKRIQVDGLQRVTQGTVLSYLPVKVGDTVGSQDTSGIIQSLFATGFFENVQLFRSGDTLVIKVKERPTIGSVKLKGNKLIPKKDLEKSLNHLGLTEGQTFDRSTLDQVQQALLQEYYARGNYSAKVNTSVKQEPRNRVAIDIDIEEGKPAVIRQIKIVGNHAFKEKELLKQFHLSTPTLLSFLTGSDKYSKQRLDADIQNLKAYYMDHGYIKVKVDSTQVSITPDKKSVYIVVRVTEGPQYFFKGYKFSGNTVFPVGTLTPLVKFKKGDVFSRQKVIDAEKAIGQALGNAGYLFVTVKPMPKVDDKKRQVMVNFDVEPGQRVYISRITYTGNTKTSDTVLRKAMRQQEGSLASISDIKESERQLKLLPYLQDIDVKTTVNPNKPDEADLNYSMKERNSAELSLSLGLSSEYGILYGAGINQSNFLGSGKSLGLNFSKDEYERNISLSYTNPYFTKDGISQSFSIYSQKFEPGQVNISDYTTEQNGVNVGYSIPVSENSSYNFGLGYQNLHVDQGSNPSTQVSSYVAQNGSTYNQILASAGWSYNGYDQAIFPTRGLNQSLTLSASLPTPVQPLEYWNGDYEAHFYHPILPNNWLILSLRGELGYGQAYGNTNGYPFFENYYAGGIGTVRSYESNTLGPTDSQGNSIGGDAILDGSLELILPSLNDNVRTSIFLDGGNVFSGTIETNQLRYSAGVAVTWRVPYLGPMVFSLGYPINRQKGDDTEPFQFQIGTTF